MTWWLVLVLLESMLLGRRSACNHATAAPQRTWAAAAKATTAPAAALGFKSTKAGVACSARQDVAQAVLHAVAHPPVSAGHKMSMNLPLQIMDSNCSCLPVTCTGHVHTINAFLTVPTCRQPKAPEVDPDDRSCLARLPAITSAANNRSNWNSTADTPPATAAAAAAE
jgi:hypothetical protein